MNSLENVVIVGSGPAGFTAAIYAARAGLEPLLLAGLTEPGGSLMKTTDVENYPGFPEGVQGPELMNDLEAQAVKFGARIIHDDATALTLDGDVKTIATEFSGTFDAHTVILAMGSAHRRLGVPGEDEYTGRGVSSCATCDGFFFRNEHIIVVGGGDSALEEALFLTRFTDKVTLVHRRSEFNASKIVQERVLASPNIAVRFDTEVTSVTGADQLDTVSLQSGPFRSIEPVPAGALFVAIGHVPRSSLVAGQVLLDGHGYVKVNHPTTATNIPGVFAAGDLVDTRYRQAITAAGTGCAAALDAERYLAEHRA